MFLVFESPYTCKWNHLCSESDVDGRFGQLLRYLYYRSWYRNVSTEQRNFCSDDDYKLRITVGQFFFVLKRVLLWARHITLYVGL